jgi:hypothetical protein
MKIEGSANGKWSDEDGKHEDTFTIDLNETGLCKVIENWYKQEIDLDELDIYELRITDFGIR